MRRATKAGIAVVVVLAVCIVGRSAILWSLRESATFSLPGGTGIVTVVRDRQEIMPIPDVMYERKIIYCRTDGLTRSWRLPADAGQNMRINVYSIGTDEKSFVRLDDAGGEYLLDRESGDLYLIVTVRSIQYAGKMDDGEIWVSAEGPSDGSQGLSTVYVGKNLAAPLAMMVSDPKGTYIGNIFKISHAWRFTSADDAPEVPIQKRFARPSRPSGEVESRL